MTTSSSVAMIDFRALCAELLEAAEDTTVLNDDSDARFEAVAERARAALAQPAPPAEGDVTDGELNAMWNCSGISDEYGNHTGNIFEFARAAIAFDRSRRVPVPETEEVTDQGLLEVLDRATANFSPNHPEAESMTGVSYALALEVRKARAVLARWGHQPAPPAEGEVGELVDSLRRASDGASAMGWEQDSWIIARAAELLAQRHPAPVPAGERLQQMEDLAADAVSALRYIEQSHGRLYGIGWDRVYEKADQLRPATAPAQPAPPVEGKVK